MTIVWTEDALKYLVPTRAEHVAGEKRPQAAAAWKAARKEYTTAHAYWAKGPEQAPPETRELLREALGWLAHDAPVEELPKDPVLATATFFAPAVLGYIAAVAGLRRAFRVTARANDFQRGFGRGATWTVPAELDSRFVFAPSVLRTWYLLEGEEMQERCRQVGVETWQSARPHVRAGLVGIVPEQFAWAREVATTWPFPAMERHLADGVLASVDDIALVPKVLKLGGAAAGVVNVVDRFGEAAVPVLSKVIEDTEQSHEAKHCARALTLIRTPQAGAALASHLGRAVVRPFAAEFFAAEPEIARAVLPEIAKGKKKVAQVAAEMLTRVERASGATASDAPEAAADALPRVLAAPPWRAAKRPRRKRGVVEGLAYLDYPEKLALGPDALRAAVESRGGYGVSGAQPMNEEELAKYLEKAAKEDGRAHFPYDWTVQRAVPDAERARVWNEAGPGLGRSFVAAAHLHAAHGLEPLPGTVTMFAKHLFRAWGQRPELTLLAALDTPQIAPSVARALPEPRMSTAAKTWLLASPERAAIGLIPTAVGRDGAARDAAERALRFLAGRGHADVLRAVGAKYGVEPARALDEVLAWDPLWDSPAKPPKMPPYWRVAELTRPKLRDGGAPLPLDAVAALDEMLAFTSIDPPYAGIADVVAACDPRSLAEHAWDLATTWEQNRAKDAHAWMLDALVHLADEEVVRRMTPALKSPKVVPVLGRIGTDAAAMELATIVARLQARGQSITHGIGAAAEKQLDEIAAARGLDPDAFEDQITPTLDVDDAGGLTLDYGSRTLRVGFDERLDPYVADDEGGRMKNLPPGRKTDDKAKVKAAQLAWKELREDVRVIADRRIASLERAMSAQRRWTAEAFRSAFVAHPLMLHLTRRLIWAAWSADGAFLGTFRVAEDRSLADSRDDRFVLSDDAKVTIPHPAAWPDATLAAWRGVLSDYQLLQPFPQLERPRLDLTGAELAGTDYTRERPAAPDGTPQTGPRLVLVGWSYKSQSAGTFTYRKPLADGRSVHASWSSQTERQGGALPITLASFDASGEKTPLSTLAPAELADALYDLYLRS